MTKMLEVEENTHLKAKAQAKQRGMTIKGYMEYLVNKDKKEIQKGK